MKKKKTITLSENEAMLETPEELSTEHTVYVEAVKNHYKQLGDQCKELLNRFYFKKDSMRNIAEHFSWTEASAKNNKYRCLQKLRQMVTENLK